MASTRTPRIVVCGHLCLDIIPGFPHVEGNHDWFRPGRLSVVDASVLSTGGAVSNVGISLHRLGLPVRLVAKIGNDPFGRLIVERLTAMGADLASGLGRVEGEVTSYSLVLNPPGVDRIFLHCPGANDTFTDEDVSDGILETASVFHFGYPPLLK
jgi:sugar/nucleoside kinase (ribokinase family)